MALAIAFVTMQNEGRLAMLERNDSVPTRQEKMAYRQTMRKVHIVA
jgi:hypothetical protein